MRLPARGRVRVPTRSPPPLSLLLSLALPDSLSLSLYLPGVEQRGTMARAECRDYMGTSLIRKRPPS